MKPKLVYIAGPFRGKSQWAIALNIRRAETLALEVWALGHVAICPHLNTAHFQGALPDDTWLKGDLEILRRCDAILMGCYWQSSKGSRAELAFAWRNKIPIFFSLANLQGVFGGRPVRIVNR